MLNALILATVVAVGGLLLWPRLSAAPLWRATITPLASIIGSGFLILGPILDTSFGGYAPLAMLALCALAWAFGAAVRFNIADIEARPDRGRTINVAETLASASLAFAFTISVAYYLNLFGAFGVSLTAVDDRYHARLLTTAILVVILVVGWTRGFAALERIEQISVGLKLAIIAGLIIGLAVHFGERASDGALAFHPPEATGWSALVLLGGLLVTVQGFETSRYLGETYNASFRIRSMRLAQILSSVIYLAYIGLLAYAFEFDGVTLDETAIIDLMQVVAPLLPVLLVVAALSAQLSAAVADTSGSGGLVAELSKGWILPRQAYAILVGNGLFLTWTSDVFEIVAYASRAFAAYYALQAGIAAIAALSSGKPGRAVFFGGLGLVGAAITALGTPVE